MGTAATPEQLEAILARAAAERWTHLALIGPRAPGRGERVRRTLLEQGWPKSSVIVLQQELSDEDASDLGNLTGLTSLDLGNNDIGDEGASHIGNLTGLTSLNLAHNRIGAEGASHIGNLTGLTSLNLDGNGISAEGASHFGNLTGLTSLSLAFNSIGTEGASQIGNLTGLTSLSLAYNGIGAEGAAHIGRLTGLTRLNLGGNDIGAEGASHIGNLTGLTSLDLDNNDLGDKGASHIGNLTGLTSLNLDGNDLGDKGASHIGTLTALTSLSLAFNGIGTEGASHIGNLAALTSLNLDGNGIGAEGASHIGKLTGLTSLNLDDNGIGAEGASHIGKLTGLTSLDLWNNSVGDEGVSHLRGMTALSELDLGENGIGDEGASHLGEMTALTHLRLMSNEIGDQGAAQFAKLTNLRHLDLDGNHLEDLSDARFSSLIHLRTLDLRGISTLRSLPPDLHQLRALRSMFLHGNTGLGLPEEMLSTIDAQQILEYYFRARAESDSDRSTPLNEVKLLVVGEPGVGKTDLTHWLVHGEPHPDPKSTSGIEITRWMLDETPPIRVNVWDFGGQEIMHATHQFFLTERSLYLLVLDSRENEEQARVRMWLDRIRAFGQDAPIIVVLNKRDEGRLEPDEAQLRSDYAENLPDTFARVACRKGEHEGAGAGIEELRSAIIKRLKTLEGVSQPVLASFLEAKRDIEREASEQRKLPRGRYDAICDHHGIDSPGQRDLLLTYLKNLGTLFHYERPGRPGQAARTYVLDPEWLTEGVYTILTDPELGHRGGVLDPASLEHIFAQSKAARAHEYTGDDFDFILEMMEGDPFELCFRIPDNPNDSRLVPEQLPPNAPDHGIDHAGSISLRYKYDFLPVGLVPRFIVRTHQALEPGSAWKSGVVLSMEGTRVLVRAERERNTLHVVTDGREEPHRRAVAVVRAQLAAIHKNMAQLRPDERIGLPDRPTVTVSVEQLRRFRDDPKKGLNYEWEPEGAERDYSVREILEQLEGELSPGPKIIESKHVDEERLAKEVVKHMLPVVRSPSAQPLQLSQRDSRLAETLRELLCKQRRDWGDADEEALVAALRDSRQKLDSRAVSQLAAYRLAVVLALAEGERMPPSPEGVARVFVRLRPLATEFWAFVCENESAGELPTAEALRQAYQRAYPKIHTAPE